MLRTILVGLTLILLAAGCVYVARNGVYQRTDSITGSNKVTKIHVPSFTP